MWNAHSLSPEAAIEIMLAILGVMIAVLTLVAGLFAATVAVFGFFGFATIRDEVLKLSGVVARDASSEVAKSTATEIANESVNQIWAQIQASGMSEGQAEPGAIDRLEAAAEVKLKAKRTRRKAVTDKNLKEGGRE